MENIEQAVKVAEEFKENLEQDRVQKELESLTPEQIQERDDSVVKEEEGRQKEIEDQVRLDEEDEIIAETPDEELDEDKKQKKQEILDKWQNDPEHKKMSRALKKNNKRIDKLTAKNKDYEAEIATLNSKLGQVDATIIEKTTPKIDIAQLVQENEMSRIATQLTEDATKERGLRREMADEELDEWFNESPREAAEWVSKRDLRRRDDFTKDQQDHEIKHNADVFINSQKASVKRLTDKYPEVRPDSRALELKNQGLPVNKILETLYQEFPAMKIVDEIASQHPDWLQKDNYGDLLMAEYEQKKGSISTEPNPSEKEVTEEDIQSRINKAVEAERERLDRTDTSGGSSTITGNTPPSDQKKLTKEEENLERIGKKSGLSDERIKSMIERHRIKKKTNGFVDLDDD